MYIARRMKQGLILNALISKYYFIICNDNQITINLNMYLYQKIFYTNQTNKFYMTLIKLINMFANDSKITTMSSFEPKLAS